MKITLKEGWVSLDMVYSFGGERWLFYREKPDYVEEVCLPGGEFVPGKLIRILYTDADNIELEQEPPLQVA